MRARSCRNAIVFGTIRAFALVCLRLEEECDVRGMIVVICIVEKVTRGDDEARTELLQTCRKKAVAQDVVLGRRGGEVQGMNGERKLGFELFQ
jgi:hypothetical protein